MPSRPDRATEVTEVPKVPDDVIIMNGYPMDTKAIVFKGKSYKFRELLVEENDLCRDAATGPEDKYDGREMMRQMIVMSAVDPEMTRADIGKIPSRLYAHFVEIVNELNDPDTLQEDKDPGNA